MTKQKRFKNHVRDRMTKTGESYTAARRQLLLQQRGAATPATDESGGAPAVAGIHSATSAFRALLRHAGHDVDEATLLAVGGGIGIGVFAFHYETFSSLFLAGRHLWHDDLLFLENLATRLDIALDVRETGSAAKAERDLLEALERGPAIAFVDLGTLRYRGGVEAYYVVTVLDASPEDGTARIADLAEAPVELPLERLAAGRAMHRKFKNRLITLADVPAALDIAGALSPGVRACVDGFRNPQMKGFQKNFTLAALDTLATRMRGSGKDAWKAVFPPGPRLWGALASFYEYVEHYGTGGGLMRPLWADALRAAAGRTTLDLAGVAESYDALGAAWSDAANAALPNDVEPFAGLRRTIDDTYATYWASGADEPDELERLRQDRHAQIDAPFPLDGEGAAAHVAQLADRMEDLVARERAALNALAASLGEA